MARTTKTQHALVDQSEFLNILYYGDGGTGKSTDLCHMADIGKIVVVNAEAGIKVRALRKCGVKVDNIEIWPEPGDPVTFKSLEAEWSRIREALHENPDSYVGFVWDSLSEVYKKLLDDVVAQGYERSLNTHKPRESEFFIDRSDYGIMTEQVRQLIRKCRDLPCHFGTCALERRDIDESDGSVVYRPAVTPALINDLYLWFDVVCHTEVLEDDDEEDEFRGLFRASGKYRGKDRFHVLPRRLVTPSFDRVLSYVEEELTVSTDPVMKAAKAKQAEKKKGAEANAEA